MVTKELIDYVNSQRALGKKDDEIRQNLVTGGGWITADLDEIFTVQKRRLSKTPFVFSTLLIAVLLIGGGYYIFTNNKVTKTEDANTTTNNYDQGNIPTNSAQNSNVPPVDQAEVIDSQYTFSLPSGWQAGPRGGAENGNGSSLVQVYSESSGSPITSSLTGVSSSDKKNIDTKSVDAMKATFAKIYPGSDIKSEPSTIGGEKAVVVSITGTKEGRPFFWASSFFVHKEILYTLLFNSTDSISRATADFQKVISSFKFITSDSNSNVSPTDPVIYKNQTNDSNIKTYSGTDFSFQYPLVLSLKQDTESVTVSHSIAYNHPDPCDFKGDAPPLDKLTDFSVSIKVVNQSVQNYIQGTGWPDWDYVSKNPYSLGSFNGYHVTPGVEGCGQNLYYLIISPNKTVVITRPLVAEFASVSGDYQKYLSLPGVISPNMAEEYFSKILSSLVVK